MGLAVLVQCREHDRQDDGGVVADEGHDVLVVPVVERPLSNLQMKELVSLRGRDPVSTVCNNH